MLGKRVLKVLAALALLIAVVGSSGIADASLGLSVTPPAHACGGSTGSGGDC